MIHVWFIGFLSTFAGIGVGGVIAALLNGFKRSIGAIYAVCTGLLLGLISFEIAPKAIQLGNLNVFFIGFLTGVILFELFHKVFHKNSVISTGLRKHHNLKLGLFLTIIISIHNLPMGIVLGTSEHTQFSTALLHTLILHNIPEGMIIFSPLFIAGIRFYLLILPSIFIALPVAIGAFFGEMIGMQNNQLWAFLISLTVGMIYRVTIKEILTEAIRHTSNTYSLLVALTSFILMGVYVIYL